MRLRSAPMVAGILVVSTIQLVTLCSLVRAAAPAGGTFGGMVDATAGRCFATTTDMSVTIAGTAVTGAWASNRVQFSGKMDGASFQAQMVTSRGETVTVKGTVSDDGQTMQAGFSGTSGCSFAGKLLKRS